MNVIPITFRPPIRFGCLVQLPWQGRFVFTEELKTDPEKFIRQWIEGAIDNIYMPSEYNKYRLHEPHQPLIQPVVKVKYLPPEKV